MHAIRPDPEPELPPEDPKEARRRRGRDRQASLGVASPAVRRLALEPEPPGNPFLDENNLVEEEASCLSGNAPERGDEPFSARQRAFDALETPSEEKRAVSPDEVMRALTSDDFQGVLSTVIPKP